MERRTKKEGNSSLNTSVFFFLFALFIYDLLLSLLICNPFSSAIFFLLYELFYRRPTLLELEKILDFFI